MNRPKRLTHGTDDKKFHDALKRDPELWERLTLPGGEMDDGDGGILVLGTCRVCLSTISKKLD